MDVAERPGRAEGEQRLSEEMAERLRALERIIAGLRREVVALRDENAALRRENEQLRRRLGECGLKGPTPRLEQAYSLHAHERRTRGPGKRKRKASRRGRTPTAEKLRRAGRCEMVLPEGCPPEQCRLFRRRPVWRIENGRAVLVAYEIHRGPRGKLPCVPGLLPRCEFGQEILVTIAYLTFVMRLSMDKVCAQLRFFWELPLSKSQADALLNRLAREWTAEFEALCTLLAHAAVVHADETRWSLNSVWAFLSESARVLLFGVRKDAATLETLLPKDHFAGVLVSDDAAVYRGFSRAQKCWAHLLRKAIRLTLLAPGRAEYREFLDGLLAVYRKGCRVARDRRLKPQTREARKLGLEDDLWALCGSRYSDDSPPADDVARDHVNLIDELMRLMEADELFTFVTEPDVEGTNNVSERGLRGSAEDRKTGRTSRTIRGARRRTVLTSVLESLSATLQEFTLRGVLQEIADWTAAGQSRFRRLLGELGLPPPHTSVLDALLPLKQN